MQGPCEPGVSVTKLMEELEIQKNKSRRAEGALKKLKKINTILRKKLTAMKKNYATIFSKDQIKKIGGKSKRGMRWENNCVFAGAL